jgi:DNA replicative helicase MCM subunit Mcm2 (Cdc46/Mcm family)
MHQSSIFENSFVDEESNEKYYVNQIQSLPEYDKTTIYVDFNHVWRFDEDLGQVVSNQYYRCVVHSSANSFSKCTLEINSIRKEWSRT